MTDLKDMTLWEAQQYINANPAVKHALLELKGYRDGDTADDDTDTVNKPSHYQGKHGMEAIDVVRNFAGNLTAEQEKRYKVIIPNVKKSRCCLIYNVGDKKWYFKSYNSKSGKFRIDHTKTELEDAGFGWVFEQGFAKEVTDD